MFSSLSAQRGITYDKFSLTVPGPPPKDGEIVRVVVGLGSQDCIAYLLVSWIYFSQ